MAASSNDSRTEAGAQVGAGRAAQARRAPRRRVAGLGEAVIAVRWAALLLSFATFSSATGCAVGTGEGEAKGSVTAPECGGLDGSEYSLKPSFFAGASVEGQLEIRIQRGSDLEDKSDGLVVLIKDADMVKRDLLGTPIELTEDGLVQMSLYLNDSCPPSISRGPVNFRSVAGSITFQNIYAPNVDSGDVETAARFENVLLVEDADNVAAGQAFLSGHFRFLYNRGRPAQRFP